jgi:hypothetical protein
MSLSMSASLTSCSVQVRKLPGHFPLGAGGGWGPQTASSYADRTIIGGGGSSGGGGSGGGGSSSGSASARLETVVELSLARLRPRLSQPAATLPSAVRRALVIEALLWAGRLPPALPESASNPSAHLPTPGPRALGVASVVATLVRQRPPLRSILPSSAAASVLSSWEFLRLAALPLGLDSVLAQVRGHACMCVCVCVCVCLCVLMCVRTCIERSAGHVLWLSSLLSLDTWSSVDR